MTQRDDEYEDVDYEGTEESRDDFFGMSDADDEYYEERPHINWVSVFSVLLAIVVAIVLCFSPRIRTRNTRAKAGLLKAVTLI